MGRLKFWCYLTVSILLLVWVGATPAQDRLDEIRERLIKERIGEELAKGLKDFNPSHLSEGLTILYTIDPCLQAGMRRFMERARLPYGAFVAIEPRSGRVLALVDYSLKDPNFAGASLKASYPAASIFKLITASAVVEKLGLTGEAKIKYRGASHAMSRNLIREDRRRDKRVTTLKEALGESNNPVFARLALRVGVRELRRYAQAFLFNQDIDFELPLEVSRATIPEESYALARSGAGFEGTYISPLHGALIASAIANDGIIMRPRIIDKVVDEEGRVLYQEGAMRLARPIRPTTARELRGMMRETVTVGTAAKIFHFLLPEAWARGIEFGGKTGTLRGNSPPGRYDWFVGLAPLDGPQIAVSALVINDGRGKVKGAHLAMEAFRIYFQEEGCIRSAH